MLSPVLFNVYFSVIVDSLEKAALGCELYDKYISCIVYADDVILLLSSVVILQRMLDICYNTVEWGTASLATLNTPLS